MTFYFTALGVGAVSFVFKPVMQILVPRSWTHISLKKKKDPFKISIPIPFSSMFVACVALLTF